MKTKDIKIYTAGKTWAAHWFRALKSDFNINANWIDFDDVLANRDDTFSEEMHADEIYKQKIWDDGCKVDCMSCDMMILACHPDDGESHSGSLVELGHVTSNNRPAYILGTCSSIEAIGHSDRAWRSQKCVFWFPKINPEDPEELRAGFDLAVSHYKATYRPQWFGKNIAQKYWAVA